MNKNTLWLLLLPTLILIFFYDIFFLGKTLSTASFLPGTTPHGPYGFSGYRPALPFSFDTGGDAWVNEPDPYIIKRMLNEGSLPAWNPHEGLGLPLIANTNNEVFNPVKTWLNFFPGPFSQDIFFLLRLFLMGFFTYLFLTEIKLSRVSCLLGASFFMLSGYSVWWINLHPLSTVMYLPGVFYFYERWSERKDLRSGFGMSLFLSFALVAGKIPDVIMGLALLFAYAVWKGLRKSSVTSLYQEAGRVIVATISGLLLASFIMLPFLRLYQHASPLAKAVRTGASSHTIPLATSVSLVEPLFLGWGNYFYGSWFKWTPDIILPHAGVVIAVLSLYALLHGGIFRKTFPFFLFLLFLFSIVYGILPGHIISGLPVLGSIEFLKYNAMFYFALAVLSASAFNDLLSPGTDKKKFNLSVAIVSFVLITYFYILYGRSPQEVKGYMITVLVLPLCGLIVIGLYSYFSIKRRVFGTTVFIFLVLELFLYMPKDHPDRFNPYQEPPYMAVIKRMGLHRITGGGSCVPPLVSSAIGLYDVRAISVLMPGSYYRFFENLLGFSLPGTNNPNSLFTATSPFIDLAGVKYIMSQEPLERRSLEDEIGSHVGSLRVEHFLESMINHTVEGGVTYGFFNPGSGKRFSLLFPMKFAFETKIRVSQPFLAAGFALADMPKDATAKVKITVENKTDELIVREGVWKDLWVDTSGYPGRVVTVRIEGKNSGNGKIVVGNFGLSPGPEKERTLYENLLALHNKEFDFLKYLGEYEGMYVYENTNVMDRAFVLHRTQAVKDLDEAIERLQGGVNFREVALVTSPAFGLSGRKRPEGRSQPFARASAINNSPIEKGDKVVIQKYTPDEIAIEADSKGGILVLSDLYYPGWGVKVNGRDGQIIKVFGLFRGVAIGEGKTEVLFYYRPMIFYAGLIISVLTFVVWMTAIVISTRRNRLSRLGEKI
jgi:hypothetical protein